MTAQSASEFYTHFDAIELMGWDAHLSHGGWRLYVRLLRLGNKIGWSTPIQGARQTLAGWLDTGPKQADRARNELSDLGLIRVTPGTPDVAGKRAKCAVIHLDIERLLSGPTVVGYDHGSVDTVDTYDHGNESDRPPDRGHIRPVPLADRYDSAGEREALRKLGMDV
jgi:hypothetical protein